MTPPKLFTAPSRPEHWVTTDDGVTYTEWPAEAGGWARRATYAGPRAGLCEVWPGSALGTGWPREGDARKVPYFPQRAPKTAS